MADNDIVIQSDLQESLSFLNSMGGNKSKMMKNLLGSVGTYAKNAAKRNYPNVLKKQTGELYSSIRRKVNRKGDSVVVTAHKREDGVRYGFVLAHGTTILPKTNKSLFIRDHFTGMILAKAKSVTIPPKDFIEGPVKEYLKTNRFKQELNQATQKQVEKLQKAAKKK